MKKDRKKPSLYIIAGPNGAGKTTFAQKFLPKYRVTANLIEVSSWNLGDIRPECAWGY
ncbi:MAG: hypothetical protein FJ106_09025 [Deltaproteobacteria bacterium]|nr:hypothetical protein [Deltaproteobacteria bacterium]